MAYKIVNKLSGKGAISEREVKKLAEMQCTTTEIANFFEVSEDTIERRFAGKLARWRKGGHCSLRRSQWIKALEGHSGDTVMLKHLGKCYLGQGDESTENSQKTLFEKFDSEMTKKGLTDKPE